MFQTNKISQMVSLILLLMFLVPILINAEILFRDTFEDDAWTPWIFDVSENGEWNRSTENYLDRYASQLHGDLSLCLKDPNGSSFANAKHSFPVLDFGKEYMVEFYFWFPPFGVDIESLYLYKPSMSSNPADLSIVLDSTDGVLLYQDALAYHVKDIFYLSISDNYSTYNYIYSDSVLVLKGDATHDDHALRWHKFQIHKLENSSTINLYVDGNLIGTYTSSSGINQPDSFLIGTENVTQNGEGFWDDFIITTVPDGEHPRLLFTQSDISGLQDRAKDGVTTDLGYSYLYMADTVIVPLADSCMSNDYFRYPYCYEYNMYYPFPQPQPSEKGSGSWLAINREIEAWLQVLSFSYVLKDSIKYADRADSILISLSNKWSQWTNMQYSQLSGGTHPYTWYDAAHLVASVAIAYDMTFDQLTDYEKMTIQNSLISMGINQDYLVAVDTLEWDDNPIYHPNGYAVIYSAMGLASLVIDDSAVSNTYGNIAQTRIEHILAEPKVCDPQGGWIEGITYGEYGTDYIIAYLDAERRVRQNNLFQRPYLQNYPEFRMYSTLFRADRDATIEVNFEDYNDLACFANEGVMYLVSENNDHYGQWYLANSFIKWPKWDGQSIELIQRYFQFGPFLWFDKELAPTSPDTLPLGMCAQNIGWGILRNGWDINSKVLAFKNGILSGDRNDWMGTHCQYAQNRFIFGGNGTWFIEEWGKEDGYQVHAYWHNVILIDGTQNQDTAIGEIKKFYTSDEYGYIMGDDSNCDSHLNKWLREIVMVNNPGFIVVKDDIVCNDSVMIDWRIHSAELLGHIDCSGDSIKITKGENYLFGKVLEPEETQWSVVPDDSVNEWKHISIVPNGSIQQVEYLVPFLISPTSASQPEITKIEGTTMLGARIKTDTTDGVVMFADEDSVETAKYELLESEVDSVFNVLVGLIPDTTYRVIVRDENMNTLSTKDLQSTDQGTLDFTVEMGGTRIIFITMDFISPTANLIAPEGGEKWEIGGLHTIEWDADDNDGILYQKILLYVGAGRKLMVTPVLIDSVDGTKREYDWDIPDVTSSNCWIGILVCDSSMNFVEDSSDYFEIGPLFSDTSLATSMNNQRKMSLWSDGNPCFLYQSARRVLFDYSEDGGALYNQCSIGDGDFPALSSYTDITEGRILGAVWVHNYVTYFSRYSDISGWSEPWHLIQWVGARIHHSPPSLMIDDDGIGHLAWEMFTEPWSYPGNISYSLYYSTFNAGLTQPDIIENDTLDEVTEYVDEWPSDIEVGSPSMDIDNDNNPVIAWSRPMGEGKNTIYFKQKGANWPVEPETVSTPADTSIHSFCDIDYGKIHVVWEEEGIIKHRQRPLSGNWGNIETVSDGNSSRNPQILDGDICVFTQTLEAPDNSNVVYRIRSEEGTWGQLQIIESMPDSSEYPQSYVEELTPYTRALHTIWTQGNEAPYKVKVSSCEIPGIPLLIINGYVYDGVGEPAYNPEVTITSLTTNEEWTPTVELGTNCYSLALGRTDVDVGDTLRIIAKKTLEDGDPYDPEGYTYIITVTDRMITQDDILTGEIDKDLYLNHYCINYYPDYQYFTQEQSNYSGAAVMQMWTDFKDVDPPYLQDDLHAMGLENNTDADSLLPYIDPQGMANTLKDIIELPPGHTFTVGVMPGDAQGLNWAMHRICWWQYTGPGALPTGGNYESWMSVRGIHTDIRPQDGHYGGSQGDWEYDVYGFWINDPDDSPASLGANSYKTADEWTSTYYPVIIDTNNPEWDSMYITVLEPPEHDALINIVSPKPRFNSQQIGQVRKLGNRGDLPEHIERWIIQAAIDGVSEELIPYDENFEAVFETTTPGTPLFINSINGNNYYAVPFNIKSDGLPEVKPISKDISKTKPASQIKPILKAKTTLETKPISDIKPISKPKPVSKSEPVPETRYKPIQAKAETKVVVLIDAEDGSFKEASWSDNSVKYLPISRTDAQQIALEIAQEMGFEMKELYPELIHRHLTPYYPEWIVIIEEEGIAIYISQDGEVTIEDLQGGPGGTMSAGVGNTPFVYFLKPISPNPFASNAVINFSIARSGNVSLNIYDISGRLIKTLIKEKRDAGLYSVKWNGENNNNKKVAAGIYFTRLKSGRFTSVKKVILVR